MTPEGIISALIIGAVITVAFTYLFAVDDSRIQALMTTSLALLIALLLALPVLPSLDFYLAYPMRLAGAVLAADW